MVPAAGLSLLLLTLGLTALWPPGLAWSAVPPALAYLAALYSGSAGLDPAAPAVGVGLLLMVELGALSLELDGRLKVEARPAGMRLGLLGAVGLVSLLAGSALLSLAALPVRGGVALTALGLAAAVGVLGIFAALARR